MFDSNPILGYILVILGIIIFISLARDYFNRNWKLVYTTFGNRDYFKIVSRLKAAGVKFKTETPVNLSRHDQTFLGNTIDNTQYDIYVKKNDEHRAVSAIHK